LLRPGEPFGLIGGSAGQLETKDKVLAAVLLDLSMMRHFPATWMYAANTGCGWQITHCIQSAAWSRRVSWC